MGVRNSELATFLSSRRHRLTGSEIGLPQSARRRTAWATRDEVAWAADVGITWYTWLEQGRPIKIAAETLNRVAATLRLDVSETEYLHKLARAHPKPLDRPGMGVTEGVRGLVEGYTAGHAFVVDPLWDLLVWNGPAADLFEIGHSGSGLERNVLWLLFTRQHLRRALPDWKEVASQTVAALRIERSDYVGNGAFDDLIAALSVESIEFREMWSEINVLLPTRWTLGPLQNGGSVGDTQYETVALPIPESPGQTLIFHYPTDEGKPNSERPVYRQPVGA
jgi:MmyB-like transcription regulator ligand binding domain/Helix-turn-helix domain